tara:strand:- start:729 stop:2129 length:1401 start_codon:yes stop_codon:yes gene_type:complete
LNRSVHAITGLFFISAILLHRESWSYIIEQAQRPDRLDLCVIAVLLTGYFIYRRQNSMQLHEKPPVLQMIGLLLGSLAVSGVGQIFDIDALSHLAALTAGCGVVVLAVQKGPAQQNVLIASSALLFALPIPGQLNDLLTPLLQESDARIVEFTLHALGLEAARQGNRVFTETAVIAIEQSCNGLMLLWPIMISAYIGYWLSKYSVGRKLQIIFSLGLFAITANLLRLLGISLAYIMFDEATADTAHSILGYGVMIGLGALPLIMLDDELRNKTFNNDITKNRIHRTRDIAGPAIYAAMLSLVFAMAPLKPVIKTDQGLPLPIAYDGWVSEPLDISAEELRILAAEALAKRRYVSMNMPDYEAVLLVAVYNDRESAGSHSAVRCFQALGWSTILSTTRRFDQIAANVSEYVFQRLNFRQHVYETIIPLSARPNAVARIQLVLPENLPHAESETLLHRFSSMVREVAI